MTAVETAVGSGVVGQADMPEAIGQEGERYVVPVPTFRNVADSLKIDRGGIRRPVVVETRRSISQLRGVWRKFARWRWHSLIVNSAAGRDGRKVAYCVRYRDELAVVKPVLDACRDAVWKYRPLIEATHYYESVSELWHAEPCRADNLGREVITERLQFIENGDCQKAVVNV